MVLPPIRSLIAALVIGHMALLNPLACWVHCLQFAPAPAEHTSSMVLVCLLHAQAPAAAEEPEAPPPHPAHAQPQAVYAGYLAPLAALAAPQGAQRPALSTQPQAPSAALAPPTPPPQPL